MTAITNHQWYRLQFSSFPESNHFIFQLNRAILSSENNKAYFKVFTPKLKSEKGKVFFIADEGSTVITKLKTEFKLVISPRPERPLIARVGGWTVEREWMFKNEPTTT